MLQGFLRKVAQNDKNLCVVLGRDPKIPIYAACLFPFIYLLLLVKVSIFLKIKGRQKEKVILFACEKNLLSTIYIYYFILLSFYLPFINIILFFYLSRITLSFYLPFICHKF